MSPLVNYAWRMLKLLRSWQYTTRLLGYRLADEGSVGLHYRSWAAMAARNCTLTAASNGPAAGLIGCSAPACGNYSVIHQMQGHTA
jgi:hypothetical protein